MPPQLNNFAKVVNSINTENQKVTFQKDADGNSSAMISRVTGDVEMPIVTLHSANNGNAVVIENAFGKSAPSTNAVQIKQALGNMGVEIRKTEVAGFTEKTGPTEVPGPKEVN
jgi:hypothetical protein